jgi:hypothetical protein
MAWNTTNDIFGIENDGRPVGTHCRPVGAWLVVRPVFQGLTPLATDCRPVGTAQTVPSGLRTVNEPEL